MKLTTIQLATAKETPLSITSTGNEAIYSLLYDMFIQVIYPKKMDKSPELISLNTGNKLRLIQVGCKPAPIGEFTLWRYGVHGIALIDIQWMKHEKGYIGDRVSSVIEIDSDQEE